MKAYTVVQAYAALDRASRIPGLFAENRPLWDELNEARAQLKIALLTENINIKLDASELDRRIKEKAL